jgi:Leucine-rich repeat (LRR) protein
LTSVTRKTLGSAARGLLQELWAEHAAHELAFERAGVVTSPEAAVEKAFADWAAQLGAATPDLLRTHTLNEIVHDAFERVVAESGDRLRGVAAPRRAELRESFDGRLDWNEFVSTRDRTYTEWRDVVLPRAAAPRSSAPTPHDGELAASIATLTDVERSTKEDWYVAYAPSLRDLAPLRRLAAVRKLSISDAEQLTDLGPLADLESLEELNFWRCGSFADFSPLASLTKLRRLSIVDTRTLPKSFEPLRALTELSLQGTRLRADALASLTSVRRLELRNVALDDWTVLSRLPSLRELDIEVRDDEQAAAVGAITGLRALEYHHERVTSLAFLERLVGLESLDVKNVDHADLTPLLSLPALESLKLAWARLRDVELLGRIQSLKDLNLFHAEGVRNLHFVAGLPRLEKLATPRDIEGLEGVDRIPALRELSIAMTRVSSLRQVASVRTLESFDASHSEWLRDVSPLAGLPVLSRVKVGFTKVSDLAPMSTLPSLEHLDIRLTRVKDLSPLAGCRKLTHLEVECLDIRSVEPLAGLPELAWVELRSCHDLTDIRPLASCPKLSYLETDGCSSLSGPRDLRELAAWRKREAPGG